MRGVPLERRAIASVPLGSMSISRTLAAALGESDGGALEDLVEPYLMQIGFLDRTQQGRKATEATYNYLGVKPAQAGLFATN